MNKIGMLAAGALALMGATAANAGNGDTPYSPKALDAALAKGCSVVLDFGAKW